jgi:protein-L-isoaspartate(D-aspartate) O-methyltransferase
MPDGNELDRMVRTQLEARDIRDPRVLEAFRTIDRARFVPPERRRDAYIDHPLPIGHNQTISQPYIVALMTQALDLAGGERVLEIGTGSGYQTAVLARLAGEVYTVEVHAPLQARARRILDDMGLANVHYRVGDGRRGWPEEAPFDRVLCAAAAEDVPPAWIEQLADGGILVTPVGGGFSQTLARIEKRGGDVRRHDFCPCRFVPLTGGEEDA